MNQPKLLKYLLRFNLFGSDFFPTHQFSKLFHSVQKNTDKGNAEEQHGIFFDRELKV